jgi:uncharacterized protein YciI
MTKFNRIAACLFAVCCLGGSLSTAQNQPAIRYAVIHKPGPAWQKDVDFTEQAGVHDHVIHYRKLQAAGKLDLGGPFLDNSGGMMVPIEGISLDEIKAFAEADPAVKSGLLALEIKPWLIVMKKPTP